MIQPWRGAIGAMCAMGLVAMASGCSVETPPVCATTCATLLEAQQSCLDDLELEWTDLGHESPESFAHSCETWSWELAVLERDAVRRGEATKGAAADHCAERTAELGDASCIDLQRLDWRVPW